MPTSVRTKVLFAVPVFIGGVARVFSTLLEHLDRTKFELHLVVLHTGGPYIENVPKDVFVHPLGVTRMRFALPGLVRVVWKVRPHVILSTLAYFNLVVLLAKSLFPTHTRIVIRESTTLSIFLQQDSQFADLLERLFGYLYAKADVVICLSDSMLDELKERFRVPPDKLTRIYNPVDSTKISSMSKLASIPFEGPGPFLVCVGRLSREKGLDLLLDAMPAVISICPSVKLAIVGEGSLERELRQQAASLGLHEAVVFLGFQQNPWPYIRNADLLVLPSRYEGLPNVVLESLILGTPVLAFDCPGSLRELRSLDERVVLVQPENSKGLAESIIAFINRDKCGNDSSPPSNLERFDLQEAVRKYSNLL